MVLAQAAAYAACQAIDRQKPVQEIDTRELRTALIENPLADHSIPEILMDNDDSTGITLTGDWQRQTTGGYGPSFLVSNTTTTASAAFSTRIRQNGDYRIYTYIPRVEHAASSTIIQITAGKTSITRNINTNNLQITGQTSGEWIALEHLRLNAGDEVRVTISNQPADHTKIPGAIVADAVLLVPR
jgi:hypothetical protein